MTFAEFWTTYLWPLIIMVAESVLLLVLLLVAIAYVLLADRKIWAAVQIRRGPNVVGPWGLFQSFADLLRDCAAVGVANIGAIAHELLRGHLVKPRPQTQSLEWQVETAAFGYLARAPVFEQRVLRPLAIRDMRRDP